MRTALTVPTIGPGLGAKRAEGVVELREKPLEAGSGFRPRKRKCACELIRGTLTKVSGSGEHPLCA